MCVFVHSERIGVDNADNSGYVSWIILIILAYPVATLENPTIYPIIRIIRGWAGARGFIQGGWGHVEGRRITGTAAWVDKSDKLDNRVCFCTFWTDRRG